MCLFKEKRSLYPKVGDYDLPIFPDPLFSPPPPPSPNPTSSLSSVSSTLHLFTSLARALASKTLALLFFSFFFTSMDDHNNPFASSSYSAANDDDPTDGWDFDLQSRNRAQRPRLLLDYHLDDDDVPDNATAEKVYLVPYRWWREVRSGDDDDRGGDGVLYSTLPEEDDSGLEILLNLRKRDSAEEGFSGREYALVPEPTWCRALIRHYNFDAAAMDDGSSFGDDEFLKDVFSLQIRLIVSWETNSLVVKISQKDNADDSFRRAYIIFGSEPKPLHIWDFSGQTTQFFRNGRFSLPNDIPGQLNQVVFLELYLHGFSEVRGWKSDDMAENHFSIDGCSVKMNGSSDYVNPYLNSGNSGPCGVMYRGVGSLGLTGIKNLGNTCFMNSAIQCLVHTPKLVDYFLGDYQKDMNTQNPLGMKGELASAFGELLRRIWAPGSRTVAPRMFKQKLASFAPQFSGYNQHDSQELLAFLLDGLHEDLNRVKCKPYFEAKDAEGRPDEEVAEEYWRNHLARNDSIIVNACQGQYRSKLVCPDCNKVSITFDPFMYLSLPLPSTTMRTMTVTVLSTDSAALPISCTVSVPISGKLIDLTDALSITCSLRDDETLLVAEIFRSRICRLLEDPSDSLGFVRDADKLVAYRLPKDFERSHLVVFLRLEKQMYYYNQEQDDIPLLASMPDPCYESDIRNIFLNSLKPFLKLDGDISDVSYDDSGNCANEDYDQEDDSSPIVWDNDSDTERGTVGEAHVNTDFKFYLGDSRKELEMNQLKVVSDWPWISRPNIPEVTVLWSEEMMSKYDTHLLTSVPVVFNNLMMSEESISLYKCLEAFLKEEPLGPEDMWFCPICKTPRQASKKLDLWRLPEILVIHLKRFSYDHYFKNKLETLVDFPVYDLDISTYITHHSSQLSSRYMLYAISNHYGGLGGGHYTAFVQLGKGSWYEFDDDRVSAVNEESIKTSAAYVLFYRRVPDV
ncbi:ubiquitin carboxyl-terminal hydrolase 8-like [Argentina anserina]|uniref:ubiquitin carboxyl-terminal hydrolase 8-like n=1 Tax=Argentina anserina TaxID=57926 RepID=UPI002176869E|nr:ubiquitin carboxyl-terminal hydrolase 8-like [Potentilla anserina]